MTEWTESTIWPKGDPLLKLWTAVNRTYISSLTTQTYIPIGWAVLKSKMALSQSNKSYSLSYVAKISPDK